MIAADGVRVVAIGSLAAVILLDRLSFWAIPVVAFVEASGAALFSAAAAGALRALVPRPQLPAATAAQSGRQAAVQLAGPPLGGALFSIARALPFVVDALSYAFSTLSLLALRTPFQETRRPATLVPPGAARGRLPLPVGPAVPTDVRAPLRPRELHRPRPAARARRDRPRPGAVGRRGRRAGRPLRRRAARRRGRSRISCAARSRQGRAAARALDVAGVHRVRRLAERLRARSALLPAAVAIPSTDSVVHGYRIAMTPDRLLGRSESVRSTISLLIAPLGPLVAGLLLGPRRRARRSPSSLRWRSCSRRGEH